MSGLKKEPGTMSEEGQANVWAALLVFQQPASFERWFQALYQDK